MADRKQTLKQANRKLLRKLVLVSIAMFGFGFALSPLYDIFCDVTGFGGRGIQEVAVESLQLHQNQREITVRFDATVNSGLNWKFRPMENTARVRLGEVSHTAYQTVNIGTEDVIGHAIYNVTPPEASLYFVKTECFCFTEQLLKQGQTRDMPVTFYISPDLPADINNITLSYTFFKDQKATLALSQGHMSQGHKTPNQSSFDKITTNDS